MSLVCISLDSKRIVLLYTLCLRDIEVLLEHIKEIIDSILSARKVRGLGDGSPRACIAFTCALAC